MDIVVTGRKMNVSDTLRSYAEDKIVSVMKVFDIDLLTAEVVLRKEQNPSNPLPYVAEITLRVKGRVIRAAEAADEMTVAIDAAADKAARQLRKYKTKVVDRKARGKKGDSAAVDTKTVDLAALENDLKVALEEEEAVVRVKEVELLPLSLDEALIQTDLLGHDFFFYLDEVTGLGNVLYRRKDGGYGLIKPKIEELDA